MRHSVRPSLGFARALAFSLAASAALAVQAAAQDTVLQRGRPVGGTLAKGDTARYRVEARDSLFVLAVAEQVSVPVVVRIVDAKGTQRGRFQGPGVGALRFSARLAEAGTYTLQVFPADERAGEYRLTLLRSEPVAKDPARRVDQLMARWGDASSPGGAVQVWRGGRTLFSKAYGMANLAYGTPFRVDTRTNIGSTSKQFTAFAVMLQAERGALSLDDDIRKHLPELPDFGDTIRVRHLLTHTSGLREFLNLLTMTGRRLDHGDWIDRSEILDIVRRQPSLQNAPGAEWNYNNTAFGLLALIVERTSGKSFPEYMRENVFEPLGMTRTMVRASPEHMIPDRSEGYTPGPDGYRETGDLAGAMGAGGIYTTIRDLETWARNFSDPRVGSRKIFDEMMTSFVLTDGKATGYGYGLSVDEQKGLRRIQHGGADVAHRSMLVYYPEIDAGVTVQSNHAGFVNPAFEIAEAFFADAMKGSATAAAGAPFDPAKYDPEDVDDFVGRYALDAAPSFILTFSREGAKLYTQATGQPRIEIVPTSDSTFALVGVEASVVFLRNAERRVTGLTLRQNGENHATRLADEAPEPWKPTAAELAAFEGRYFSDEIETFYTLSVEEDKLVARQRRMDDMKLAPGDRDAFSGGNLNFTFERDRNGKVIGFYLSNGRTRNVRFGIVR
ncbi:MAG TPA: serine hydrolase domain-containing protein [Longimicrobiales bacterium]|nr:serine hydrolase domain-containing protein [Longimicrobiales bacterium]